MEDRLKNLLSTIFALPLLLCVLAACSDDDDYHYPSVRLEFLTAHTDGSGTIKTVLTDDGKVLNVVEDASGIDFEGNSTVRLVSNYAAATSASGEQGVKLYASLKALSPVPQPEAKFENGIERDPVGVISIWMGLHYLNMILDVKAQNGTHSFHFVEKHVNSEGTKCTVNLQLYHKDEDVQAYSKRAYLSVPLKQYATDGVETVAVIFSLNTYSGEEKSYQFEYKP